MYDELFSLIAKEPEFLTFNTITTFKKTFLLFIPYVLKEPTARKSLVFAIGLILLDIAAASLVPLYSKQVVDNLNNPLLGLGVALVLLLGLFWTLEKILAHVQELVFFPVINHAIRDITYDLIQHIHSLPLKDYQKLSISETLNCIKRIGFSARPFLKIVCLIIVPSFIKTIIAVLMVLSLNLKFCSALLFISMVTSLILLYKGVVWYATAREASWDFSDKVVLRINDSLLNTKVSRFSEKQEMSALKSLLHQEAILWYNTTFRLQLVHIAIGLLLGISVTVILYFTIKGIHGGTLSVGDFVLIKGQLLAAFLPFKTLSFEFRQLAEATVDIKKIINLFETSKINEVHEKGIGVLQEFPHTTVSCQQNPLSSLYAINLSFGYEPNHLLFENISLTLSPGERIAIIGESGCGKSSLLHLLTGLYPPKTGNIYLNKTPITHYTKDALKKHIYLIPQDFRLFNMTLRDNITYGNSTVTTQQLEDILGRVGLLDLVARLPQGLDTPLGEMASRLSGGEKQRVAIGRALLFKPERLILDETFYSLEENAEKMLLNEIYKEVDTIILVSHRQSSLQQMHRVLELKKMNVMAECL